MQMDFSRPNWDYNLSAVASGLNVRIEFSGIPSYLQAGSSHNSTSITNSTVKVRKHKKRINRLIKEVNKNLVQIPDYINACS